MIDWMGVVERLGGELVSLVPRRAKEAGGQSPGMVLTVKIGDHRIEIEEWFARVLQERLRSDSE